MTHQQQQGTSGTAGKPACGLCGCMLATGEANLFLPYQNGGMLGFPLFVPAGVVTYVHENPQKFSSENIADVVYGEWRPGGFSPSFLPLLLSEHIADVVCGFIEKET